MNKWKHLWLKISISSFALAAITGCNQNEITTSSSTQTSPVPSQTSSSSLKEETSNSTQLEKNSNHSEEKSRIGQEEALLIALSNANVPEKDAYNIKNEQDEDNGIPIYDIEFETQYGDYDFEVSIADGWIVGADYEVDEEWLDSLGGNAVTIEEVRNIIQTKVPGSSPEEIQIWEEDEDGRSRYEGELFYNGMKYEFEVDTKTGIIFDWNADLRN